jgi:hypothetical protein
MGRVAKTGFEGVTPANDDIIIDGMIYAKYAIIHQIISTQKTRDVGCAEKFHIYLIFKNIGYNVIDFPITLFQI